MNSGEKTSNSDLEKKRDGKKIQKYSTLYVFIFFTARLICIMYICSTLVTNKTFQTTKQKVGLQIQWTVLPV